MDTETIDVDDAIILVFKAGAKVGIDKNTANEVITLCFENGANFVLFDEGSLSPEFVQLSSGIAGEVLQKLVNYRVIGAAVLPDSTAAMGRFGELALEMNKGRQFRFYADREAAVAWLTSEATPD